MKTATVALAGIAMLGLLAFIALETHRGRVINEQTATQAAEIARDTQRVRNYAWQIMQSTDQTADQAEAIAKQLEQAAIITRCVEAEKYKNLKHRSPVWLKDPDDCYKLQ